MTDLFGQLSERREMMSQLGRDGMTLRSVSLLYFVFSALFSLIFFLVRPPLTEYLTVFLAMTAFILLGILVAETNNSLVNPLEGLVLAHQPIDGATYTAAKLTHLLRILLYLVPAVNGVPALVGLAFKGFPWFYPIIHIVAAYGVGLLVALFCCALFGWLIRFVSAARLKTVGNWVEMMTWMAFVLFPSAQRWLRHGHISTWLPVGAEARLILAVACGALAVWSVVFGLRSLSIDYMIQVASIVHSGSAAKAKMRRARATCPMAGWLGGQPGRAGFEYVSRMMRRDWQFQRQVIPLIVAAIFYLIINSAYIAHGFRITPFSGRFTALHFLPHILGFVLLAICSALGFSNDYKGAWIFLLAPAGALRGFARGVHALLWLEFIVIPHLFLLSLLTWQWGFRAAGIFIAYSLAVASFYLGLELRLIEAIPFSQQPMASRNAMMVPFVFGGAITIALAVAGQYFFVFRSAMTVSVTTLVIATGAYFLTRSSLRALTASMRFNLGILSGESTWIYKEVA